MIWQSKPAKGYCNSNFGNKAVNKKTDIYTNSGFYLEFTKIYRHGLLAKITGIQNNVSPVNSIIENNKSEDKFNLNDLDVPQQYRSKIEKLVLQN